jgi:catalase
MMKTLPAFATITRLARLKSAGRVTAIGVVLLGIGTAFLYLRGWLTPSAKTQDEFVDAFERVGGLHPGVRRNHVKGIGVVGMFDANGEGVHLADAEVFRAGRYPVVGRFSLGGGKPDVVDTPEAVRGLGLMFSPPGGGEWRTAMINLPVFTTRTPEAFLELLQASDAEKKQAFLARHPESARAFSVIKERVISSGFGDSTFRSLNAFRFTNAAGVSTFVRWEFVPEQTVRMSSALPSQPNGLFDQLTSDLQRSPLRWKLIVVVAQPGDPTNDATTAWPADRERVHVGTLILDRVEAEDVSPATDITFDPLVLPKGMAPSDDPLLSARSAVYSRGFIRRAGETKPASDVTSHPTGGKK